ncbi:hypothetical protein [Hymenobacter volaticus]|uniref:hypothetical protein n=1 Tax=Hymenobacter volaticus TaxID=2932254 RepID=UPI001FD67ABC|nr:hypothetical protein [Hymenobacter volaticus]
MSATETQAGPGHQLRLNFHDDHQYQCANYGLTTDYRLDERQLNFTFSGVTEPNGVCTTSTGPANSFIDISELATGTYTLKLKVGNKSTMGVLELQDDYLSLRSSDPDIVEVSTPELRFQPPHIIWGYATTSLPPAQVSVRVLRDSLVQLGATPLTLTPGTYPQFTITEYGFLKPPQVSAGTRALVFLAKYQGPAERIQAFVERTNAATPGLNLWLNTSGI